MKLSASLIYTLPCCGVVLQHTVRRHGEESDAAANFPKFCADVLGWWMQDRTKFHDCALVTAENITGRMPHERRQQILRIEQETAVAAANLLNMQPEG